MLTRDELIKRGTRGNILEAMMKHNMIKLKKNVTVLMLAEACAQQDALKYGLQDRPKCFSVLYDIETDCRECKLKDYCEIAFFWRQKKIGTTIAEHDLQEDAPFGFRDGSRAATLIKAWRSNLLTKGELRELSYTQFKSLIDIERILTELRKRNLLIHDGKYFGIRRSTA